MPRTGSPAPTSTTGSTTAGSTSSASGTAATCRCSRRTTSSEEPAPGGLLATSVGRGGYVYVAYSLFRQIPAGVPGAIRLFANLLGLADVRVRERAEHPRQGVELFSDLSDEERYDAAKIVAERWVDAGTVLAREGERGHEMFILLSGRIEVLKEQAGTRATAAPRRGARREPRRADPARRHPALGQSASGDGRRGPGGAGRRIRRLAAMRKPGFSRRILARLAEKIVAKDAIS